jgi:hypothetical protein
MLLMVQPPPRDSASDHRLAVKSHGRWRFFARPDAQAFDRMERERRRSTAAPFALQPPPTAAVPPAVTSGVAVGAIAPANRPVLGVEDPLARFTHLHTPHGFNSLFPSQRDAGDCT